jgi:hypothetical protein
MERVVSSLLVSSDFSKSDSSGPVSVGLLDTSRDLRGGLSSGLGGDCGLVWCMWAWIGRARGEKGEGCGQEVEVRRGSHCSGRGRVKEILTLLSGRFATGGLSCGLLHGQSMFDSGRGWDRVRG